MLKAWQGATFSADQLRASFKALHTDELKRRAVDLTCVAVGEEHRQEVSQYLSSLTLHIVDGHKSKNGNDNTGQRKGTPKKDTKAVSAEEYANVTLLEAPSLRPSLYFSSSIFRAVGPLVAPVGSLTTACITHIGDRAAAVGAALRSGRVHVRMLGGDAFDLCQFPTADVVEVSNLADYVGLPNILLLGARLGHRVIGQAMQAHLFPNPSDYFKNSFGIDEPSFSDLAGLRLCSVKVQRTRSLHMVWTRAARQRSKSQRAQTALSFAQHICKATRPNTSGGVNAATAVTDAESVVTAASDVEYVLNNYAVAP